MLRSLVRVLGSSGWRCEAVGTASLALGKLAGEAFDALVADYRIEPFNGIELCRRARLAGFDGPMVLYSGHVDADARARALRAGVHAVVPKDTDGEVLAEQLACRGGRGGRGKANKADASAAADAAPAKPATLPTNGASTAVAPGMPGASPLAS